MKRHILIPTDFSDNAWSAIIYALKLFANEYCRFYFLHSWSATNSDSRTYITTHYVDSFKEDSKKQLTELKNQVEQANANSNHDFEIIFSTDTLVHAIEKATNTMDIDLIMMGTTGATGVNKYLFGSNTVHTIQHLKFCPILVVPFEYEFITPKHIAFATDFNRFYDYKELKPLIDLADLFNAHIYIVHINVEKELSELQEYNMTMLKEHLKNNEHSFHWIPKYANKSDEINSFIEDLKIHILAMHKYKHSIIENILKEPIIKKIGYHPTVPFLVIPD